MTKTLKNPYGQNSARFYCVTPCGVLQEFRHELVVVVGNDLCHTNLSKLIKYFAVWCRDRPDTPDDVGSVLEVMGSILVVLSLHWNERFVTGLLSRGRV